VSKTQLVDLTPTLVTYPSGSCRDDAIVLHVMTDPRTGTGQRLLVVTDVTPFHPLDSLWPDQPADHGQLLVGGEAYPVSDTVTIAQRAGGPVMVDEAIDARRGEPGVLFLVAHVLKATSLGGLGVGTRVTLAVDAARRLRLSAAHTSCHLLAYAFNQETQDLWKKPTSLDSRGYHNLDAASCVFTQHDVGGSLDKYRLGKSLRKRGFDSPRFVEEIPSIIGGVNRTLAKWIESDAAVRIDCAGPLLTDWRQWVCDLPGGSAFMPCGGTHVQRLRQIHTMTAVASFDAAAGILAIRNEVRVAA